MIHRNMLGIATGIFVACISSGAFAKSRAVGLRGNPGQFFGPDSYPVEALVLRQQGRVVTRLWIDRFGKVASCTVETSSGSPSLDKATCDIALEKVVFEPALDAKGRAIAASNVMPVRWILPDGPFDVGLHPPPRWTMDMTLSIEPGGRVAACNANGTPKLTRNPCDEYPVGSKSNNEWVRNGKPVGGMIKQHMSQEVEIDP